MTQHSSVDDELRERVADICRTGHYGIAETRVVNAIATLIEAEATRRELALLDELEELRPVTAGWEDVRFGNRVSSYIKQKRQALLTKEEK